MPTDPLKIPNFQKCTKKEVFFDPVLFWPTDNEEADMAYIWAYFKGVKGGNPEMGLD